MIAVFSDGVADKSHIIWCDGTPVVRNLAKSAEFVYCTTVVPYSFDTGGKHTPVRPCRPRHGWSLSSVAKPVYEKRIRRK